jgi:hypothetical protein
MIDIGAPTAHFELPDPKYVAELITVARRDGGETVGRREERTLYARANTLPQYASPGPGDAKQGAPTGAT